VSSKAKGLAGRYAGALYDLCVDAKATDNVLSDLKAIQLLIIEHESLAQLVSSPVYSRDEQAAAMLAIANKAGAHQLTANFIGAVAQNGRLFALHILLTLLLQKLPFVMVRFQQKLSAQLHLTIHAKRWSKRQSQILLGLKKYRWK